jgi:hypothetical protein
MGRGQSTQMERVLRVEGWRAERFNEWDGTFEWAWLELQLSTSRLKRFNITSCWLVSRREQMNDQPARPGYEMELEHGAEILVLLVLVLTAIGDDGR